MADDDPIRKPLRNQSLFPPEFPLELQSKVQAAKLRAKKKFEREKKALPLLPWLDGGHGFLARNQPLFEKHRFDVRNLRDGYILRTFRMSVYVIRRKMPWSAPEMLRIGWDFFRRLVIVIESEEPYDNWTHPLGSSLDDSGNDLRPEEWSRFRGTRSWHYFEAVVLQLAETPPPAPKLAEQRPPAPEPALAEPERQLRKAKPSDTTEFEKVPARTVEPKVAIWEEVEITFLSDERVQIVAGRVRETFNYAELGFADRRNQLPNRAWQALRLLAENRGTIAEATGRERNWSRVERRMQEVRRNLRTYFGLETDPLPFIPGTGYRARFKISASPSVNA